VERIVPPKYEPIYPKSYSKVAEPYNNLPKYEQTFVPRFQSAQSAQSHPIIGIFLKKYA
jgi:hypothetical protein